MYNFDRIDSPHFGWPFTINHATLVPEGIAGFLDAMPSERLRQVRAADNNDQYEIHMYPGTGIIDFTDMFRRIEATDIRGHYMRADGTLDEMLRGREELVRSPIVPGCGTRVAANAAAGWAKPTPRPGSSAPRKGAPVILTWHTREVWRRHRCAGFTLEGTESVLPSRRHDRESQ